MPLVDTVIAPVEALCLARHVRGLVVTSRSVVIFSYRKQLAVIIPALTVGSDSSSLHLRLHHSFYVEFHCMYLFSLTTDIAKSTQSH